MVYPNNNYFGSNNVAGQPDQNSMGLPNWNEGLQNAQLPATGSNLQFGGANGGQPNNGFFGNITAQGLGQTMQGVAGLGQFGLGVANYFQNKNMYKDARNLQLANFAEQKKAAAFNAQNELDRLRRHGAATREGAEAANRITRI